MNLLRHLQRRRKVALAALFSSAVVIAGFSSFYADGLLYFAADSRLCSSCHVMNSFYNSWTNGGHRKGATCSQCHVPATFVSGVSVKIENAYRRSKGVWLENFKGPVAISEKSRAVVQANCLHCHGYSAHEWMKAKGSVDCIVCHKNTGHAH